MGCSLSAELEDEADGEPDEPETAAEGGAPPRNPDAPGRWTVGPIPVQLISPPALFATKIFSMFHACPWDLG